MTDFALARFVQAPNGAEAVNRGLNQGLSTFLNMEQAKIAPELNQERLKAAKLNNELAPFLAGEQLQGARLNNELRAARIDSLQGEERAREEAAIKQGLVREIDFVLRGGPETERQARYAQSLGRVRQVIPGLQLPDTLDDQTRLVLEKARVDLGGEVVLPEQAKVFAPTPIVTEDGIQTVIPSVSGGQVENLVVGRAPKVTPQGEVDLAIQKAQGVEQVKTDETRNRNRQKVQDDTEAVFVANAFAASQELEDINRAIELIDVVKQGGFEAAKAQARDFLGDTSGDVGELRRLLAQNVLDGLSAFTGAISEGERDFLERISTSISTSRDVNERQLLRLKRIAEKSIRRGVSILERRAAQGDSAAQETLALFGQENPTAVTTTKRQEDPLGLFQ